MKKEVDLNKRNFLRLVGVAGVGVLVARIPACVVPRDENMSETIDWKRSWMPDLFNVVDWARKNQNNRKAVDYVQVGINTAVDLYKEDKLILKKFSFNDVAVSLGEERNLENERVYVITESSGNMNAATIGRFAAMVNRIYMFEEAAFLDEKNMKLHQRYSSELVRGWARKKGHKDPELENDIAVFGIDLSEAAMVLSGSDRTVNDALDAWGVVVNSADLYLALSNKKFIEELINNNKNMSKEEVNALNLELVEYNRQVYEYSNNARLNYKTILGNSKQLEVFKEIQAKVKVGDSFWNHLEENEDGTTI